jgi:hypothetical protein
MRRTIAVERSGSMATRRAFPGIFIDRFFSRFWAGPSGLGYRDA